MKRSIPKNTNILSFVYNHKAVRHNGVMAELPMMQTIKHKPSGKVFTLHAYLLQWGCNHRTVNNKPRLSVYDKAGGEIGVEIDWNRMCFGFYPL